MTTKKRDKGREKITRSRDPREIALAKIPGPSSQAGIKEKGFNLLEKLTTYFSSKLYLNRVNHKELIIPFRKLFSFCSTYQQVLTS